MLWYYSGPDRSPEGYYKPVTCYDAIAFMLFGVAVLKPVQHRSCLLWGPAAAGLTPAN